jgi:hypothetical protein
MYISQYHNSRQRELGPDAISSVRAARSAPVDTKAAWRGACKHPDCQPCAPADILVACYMAGKARPCFSNKIRTVAATEYDLWVPQWGLSAGSSLGVLVDLLQLFWPSLLPTSLHLNPAHVEETVRVCLPLGNCRVPAGRHRRQCSQQWKVVCDNSHAVTKRGEMAQFKIPQLM